MQRMFSMPDGYVREEVPTFTTILRILSKSSMGGSPLVKNTNTIKFYHDFTGGTIREMDLRQRNQNFSAKFTKLLILL
jgi:hypothetical protein